MKRKTTLAAPHKGQKLANPRSCLVIAAACMAAGLTLASPAFCGDIFNGTGEDLYNDVNAQFPTDTPTVVGTSLQFSHPGILLVWARYPIFPSGSFDASSPEVGVEIEIAHSIVDSLDDDFRVGITDGFRVLDVAYANNNGGVVGSELESTITGTQLNRGPFNQFFDNGPVGAVFNVTFVLGSSSSAVTATLGDLYIGSESGGPALDRSAGLDFLLISGNDDSILLDTLRISSPQSGPTYACVGFEAPLHSEPVMVRKKRALPLKAQLLDSESIVIGGIDLEYPPALQVTFSPVVGGEPEDVTEIALAVGRGTEGNLFEFDGDRWRYNLKTSNYTAPGTYTATMVSGDDYVLAPNCEAVFVVQ